jgi:3-methyl-2-oxobutanoate hydroxymethyltransferase
MPPAAPGRWTVDEEEAMPDPRSASVTVPKVRATKVRDGRPPLVMVTAYDAPGARIADAAGVDMILVGDSVANVVLGYEDTLQVTVDDMAHHVAAVARARPGALVVGDLPWMSYHVDVADTVRNAATLIRAGAQCVKLEGGAVRAPMVEALVRAEIPVMGHIGLTPQSVHAFGGFKVQARDDDAAHALIEGATALVDAGIFAVVVEAVPEKVGSAVTDALEVPTIGIGAGPHCDGQVLVMHDLLGITGETAKFVRRYAELADDATAAVAAFAADVRSGAFPADAEVYH